MSAPPACPPPRPAWQRGALRIAAAAWWSLIMLRLIRREVARAARTAVASVRWRRRPLIRGGWPARRHPDQLNARLSVRDEAYLVVLDAEITAGLPMPLRIVLTRQLMPREPGRHAMNAPARATPGRAARAVPPGPAASTVPGRRCGWPGRKCGAGAGARWHEPPAAIRRRGRRDVRCLSPAAGPGLYPCPLIHDHGGPSDCYRRLAQGRTS